MDIPENQVNFRTLLQRLMIELMAEEKERETLAIEKSLKEREESKRADVERRKQLKAEAEERSRLRMLERQKAKDADGVKTSQPVQHAGEHCDATSETPVAAEALDKEETSEETESMQENDPFRIGKSRNKVSVRWNTELKL